MNSVIEKISNAGIIPVVKIDDAANAKALAGALVRGGLCSAEITFRTDAAKEAIKLINESYPQMTVGAGTVLTTKQVDEAMEAGAEFIVSPGSNPEVIKYCVEKGYPIVPGVVTPSEIEADMALGLTYLKFFPAEPAGGLKMIKAMSAPYRQIKFMPTGGISPSNVRDYLSCSAIFACGGSWMVPSDAIAAGDFDKIEKLAAEAAAIVKEIRSK